MTEGRAESGRVASRSGGSASYWEHRANRNVHEWGKQDVERLLLAAQEELGELTQAVLEERTEDGTPLEIQAELDDLAALMFQLQWAIENEHGGIYDGE